MESHMADVADATHPGFEAAKAANLRVYDTIPWPAVDTNPSTSGPIPADLGLSLIRGPISYLFLEPKDPGLRLPSIVLLGDLHATEYCALTCEDATCVSAQDRTLNTFLTYLDKTYGALPPDVFMEKWTQKEARRGEAERNDASDAGKPGPLHNFIYNALPCAYKDRKTVVDGVPTPCPYSNLRVHVADTRADYAGGLLVPSMLYDISASIFKSYAARNFPGFTAEAVVYSVLDPSPKKFFMDPFYLTFSRVTHELRQLPLSLQASLLVAIESLEYPSPVPPGYESKIMAWLAGPGDADLDPDTNTFVKAYANKEGVLTASCMALDLYFIARALKVTKDGKRCALAVAYFGNAHIQSIAYLLTRSGLYGLKKMVDQGEKGTRTHRCLVLNPNKDLVTAVGEMAHDAYQGPVLPGPAQAHLLAPRAPSKPPSRPLAAAPKPPPRISAPYAMTFERPVAHTTPRPSVVPGTTAARKGSARPAQQPTPMAARRPKPLPPKTPSRPSPRPKPMTKVKSRPSTRTKTKTKTRTRTKTRTKTPTPTKRKAKAPAPRKRTPTPRKPARKPRGTRTRGRK